MNINSLPILTLHILGVELENSFQAQLSFFNNVIWMVEKHKEVFDKEGISIDIFHNERIEYSGIQFKTRMRSPFFTAIGKKEVRAVELWFSMFKAQLGNAQLFAQEIRENYTPILTTDFWKYQTQNFLVKREVDEELVNYKNRFAAYDRLQKYLYGNIKGFLVNVVQMEFQKDDFISVKVEKFKRGDMEKTWHGGQLASYTINFSTNVYLPQTLRLGQSTIMGYGEIKHL